MVSFNKLWKISVVVAFGLSTTATSTDVAQEKPKESVESGLSHENEEPSAKAQEVSKTETGEPPMYSLEWYLLPKPENRKHLRDRLPWSSQSCLPNDCNKPINPRYANRIREYFSLYTVDWYLLPKQENRTALRYMLPKDLAEKVPEDCNEPLDPEVEKDVKKHFKVIEKKQRPNWFFRYY